jgi:hypothetical protein
VLAFAKAVGMGTLTAAGVPTALIIVGFFSFSNGTDSLSVLGLVFACFLAVVIAFAFVFVGSVLIGLPATLLLRRYDVESPEAYIVVGCVGGFALPIAALATMPGGSEWLVVSTLGVFSGGVTARTWWVCGRCEKRAAALHPRVR